MTSLPEGRPASHIYFSQRLRLHYVDWGNEEAPPMLLVHGGRDHCRNWDWVAQALKDDYHIIAPDLRGHGDSQWLVGGSYSIIDYVYDLAQLVHHIELEELVVVGHSMGGYLSLAYAGLYPHKVRKLISIEGMGILSRLADELSRLADEATFDHEPLLAWAETMQQLSGRIPKRYATLEDALRRMRQANPHLSVEQARHLTIHGSNRNEDGTYSWKFDNYIRAWSPIGLSARQIRALYRRIDCPTLLVRGTESWASDEEEDGQMDCFQDARSIAIDGAGHWVHHDQLERFLAVVKQFLSD